MLYFLGIVSGLSGLVGVLVTLASAFGPGGVFLRGGLSMLLLVLGGVSIAVAMAYDLQANADLEVVREGPLTEDEPRRPGVER